MLFDGAGFLVAIIPLLGHGFLVLDRSYQLRLPLTEASIARSATLVRAAVNPTALKDQQAQEAREAKHVIEDYLSAVAYLDTTSDGYRLLLISGVVVCIEGFVKTIETGKYLYFLSSVFFLLTLFVGLYFLVKVMNRRLEGQAELGNPGMGLMKSYVQSSLRLLGGMRTHPSSGKRGGPPRRWFTGLSSICAWRYYLPVLSVLVVALYFYVVGLLEHSLT